MKNPETINSDLANLPEARLVDLYAGDGMIKIPKRQGILNTQTKEIVSIISDRYQLVQHEEAFRPLPKKYK